MTHFGIISPAAVGHLNPMTTLGRELKRRGHRVTLIGAPFGKSKALAAGLDFWVIGESEFPSDRTVERYAKLGQLTGLDALAYNLSLVKEDAAMILRETPAAAKAAGVDAFLIDQVSYEGITVAQYLDLPYITACTGVMLNREYTIPPFFTSWNYNPAWWARLRNRYGYAKSDRIGKPVMEVIDEFRKEWKLPIYSHPEQAYSKLAQLSPQPAEFEFPRSALPKFFHFTGPYYNQASREPVAFPWEKLTGQPLIYASMGTLQNRLIEIFQSIAEACVGLDAQLVISLGGAGKPESLPKLPGSPLVVGYAPQLELLQKAAVAITHAGMNTALESLSNGVPMVAIPITNDQPGVAARVAWTGAGEVVPLPSLDVPKLRTAIQRVLTQDSYKKNASRLQEAIALAGGVSRAADIIEQAISTGKPVLSANR
jgi:MGT family glycosyltransferase